MRLSSFSNGGLNYFRDVLEVLITILSSLSLTLETIEGRADFLVLRIPPGIISGSLFKSSAGVAVFFRF